jgi:hypothetical protein
MRRHALVGTAILSCVALLGLSQVSCNGDNTKAAPAPPKLGITTGSLPDGVTGHDYSASLQATGGTAPYMWSVTSGSLPAGVTLDPSTGQLSGPPTAAGTANATIQVQDSRNPANTATHDFSIRIADPLAIGTATLPNGTDDVAYSASVSTSGGLAPLSFSISAGALPAGLSLDAANGTITGPPTTGGSFNFTVQVGDSLVPQQVQTQAFTVLVLEIAGTNPPDGTLGAAYSHSLSSSGGVGALTWSLAVGTLPDGLHLDAGGTISGTPTTAGTSNFTVQVTDSDSPARTDVQALSLSVNNPVPSITTLTPSSAQAGDPAFTLTVDGADFVNGAVVQWNGADRTTTFVSSTQLTAEIPAGDIAAVGTAQVQVANPAPGGGVSNVLDFTISAGPNPVPQLASLQPSSATATGPAFTLTVNGSAFVSNSVVRWAGNDRTTTFVSSTQLTAQISETDIAAEGSADVTVFNPTPGGGTSNALTFTINPVPPAAGVLEIVSVDSSGTQGNAASQRPATSMNGRYVAFVSDADNLVAGDSPQTPDAFLRDTCRGAGTGCVPSTTLLSAAPGGGPTGAVVVPTSSGGSRALAISSDARYVAFEDRSVVPGFGTVVVRDTCIGAPGGCTPATIVVSKLDDGTAEPSALLGLGQPAMSGDGRFVAFASSSASLVPNDTNGVPDVFLHDRDVDGNGVFDEANTAGMADKNGTARVSLASDGSEAAADASLFGSGAPSVSADGRYVAFQSFADNLIGIGADVNSSADIFVRDTCTGAPGGCTATTVLVSLDVNLDPFPFDGFTPVDSQSPSITSDGRYVAFALPISNIVKAGIYVFDRDADGNGVLDETCAGCRTSSRVPTFNPISVNETCCPTLLRNPSVSDDGRLVAFEGYDLDRPSTITLASPLVLVHDFLFAETFSVSIPPDPLVPVDGPSFLPSMSADGRVVAFQSSATNLGPTDTNGTTDVFLSSTGVDPAAPKLPVVTQISPTSVTAGGASFTLTVSGMNFETGAIIRWNGSDRTTTFNSSKSVSAAISASDIASPGTAQITVFDPVCNCTSNAFTFTIN